MEALACVKKDRGPRSERGSNPFTPRTPFQWKSCQPSPHGEVFDKMRDHAKATEDSSGRKQWTFLGRPVCFHSWKRLLSIGFRAALSKGLVQ